MVFYSASFQRRQWRRVVAVFVLVCSIINFNFATVKVCTNGEKKTASSERERARETESHVWANEWINTKQINKCHFVASVLLIFLVFAWPVVCHAALYGRHYQDSKCVPNKLFQMILVYSCSKRTVHGALISFSRLLLCCCCMLLFSAYRWRLIITKVWSGCVFIFCSAINSNLCSVVFFSFFTY